jgi:hypothetical protein
MLDQEEYRQLTQYLNRLQNQEVRVELSSRLNIGFRFSFALKVNATAGKYNFVSKSGEVSVFIDPASAEAFSIDGNSVSLVYGDNLISIRFGRTR